ncbi:MAG: DNA alkylation repair protein [Bacillaceae bacterium]|nr:DNA alkylation repair protein [Bacillaceae bacterium]
MESPYYCPFCKGNRQRFNIIEQVPRPVKKDPATGEILQEYQDDALDPFHMPYRGVQRKIQCALCGIIEDEEVYVRMAQSHPHPSM